MASKRSELPVRPTSDARSTIDAVEIDSVGSFSATSSAKMSPACTASRLLPAKAGPSSDTSSVPLESDLPPIVNGCWTSSTPQNLLLPVLMPAYDPLTSTDWVPPVGSLAIVVGRNRWISVSPLPLRSSTKSPACRLFPATVTAVSTSAKSRMSSPVLPGLRSTTWKLPLP